VGGGGIFCSYANSPHPGIVPKPPSSGTGQAFKGRSSIEKIRRAAFPIKPQKTGRGRAAPIGEMKKKKKKRKKKKKTKEKCPLTPRFFAPHKERNSGRDKLCVFFM